MATGVGIIYSGAKAAISLPAFSIESTRLPQTFPELLPIWSAVFSVRWKNSDLPTARPSIFGVFPSAPSTQRKARWRTPIRGKGAGFKPTFNTELISGNVKLAKFKLDWFFVKAGIDTPRDAKGPYQFAPQFARTLVNLNNCPPEPIADHSPMTIDLPFNEPIQQSNNGKAR
jgi:hypothetical protein